MAEGQAGRQTDVCTDVHGNPRDRFKGGYEAPNADAMN